MSVCLLLLPVLYHVVGFSYQTIIRGMCGGSVATSNEMADNLPSFSTDSGCYQTSVRPSGTRATYYLETTLIVYETHNSSRRPRSRTSGSNYRPLASMVWRTPQSRSDACRQDNRPIASKGRAADNDVLLGYSGFPLLALE